MLAIALSSNYIQCTFGASALGGAAGQVRQGQSRWTAVRWARASKHKLRGAWRTTPPVTLTWHYLGCPFLLSSMAFRRVVGAIGRGLRETGQSIERMGARAQVTF